MSGECKAPTTDELDHLMRKHAMTVGFSVLWGCFIAKGVNGTQIEEYMDSNLVRAIRGLDVKICGGPT